MSFKPRLFAMHELKALPFPLLGILPCSILAYLIGWLVAPAAAGQIGFGVTVGYLILVAILWMLFGFRLMPSTASSSPIEPSLLSLAGRNYLCASLIVAAALALLILPDDESVWRSVSFTLLMFAGFMLAPGLYRRRP